jgi:hypothetical protein
MSHLSADDLTAIQARLADCELLGYRIQVSQDDRSKAAGSKIGAAKDGFTKVGAGKVGTPKPGIQMV